MKAKTDAQQIGELIGTVAGLVKSFSDVQKAQSDNRQEFMDVFRGIRADNKEVLMELRKHISDEAPIHAAVVDMQSWKGDVSLQVRNLWDRNIAQQGAFGLGKYIAGGAGGFMIAVVTVIIDRMFHI